VNILNIKKEDLDVEGFNDLRMMQRGSDLIGDMRGEIMRNINLFRSVIGESVKFTIDVKIRTTHPTTGVVYVITLTISKYEDAEFVLNPVHATDDKAVKRIQMNESTMLPFYTVIPIMAAMPAVKDAIEAMSFDAQQNFAYLRDTVELWNKLHKEESPRSLFQRMRNWLGRR
jgi:hypothetical protein